MTTEQMARKLKQLWMRELEIRPEVAWENVAECVLSLLQEDRKRMITEVASWDNPSKLRMHAGEMTAQEVRTVRAVVRAIVAELLERARQSANAAAKE